MANYPYRVGTEFTHLQYLDPKWKPAAGETWRDCPQARCVITKLTQARVYHEYVDVSGHGDWIDRGDFDAYYCHYHFCGAWLGPDQWHCDRCD